MTTPKRTPLATESEWEENENANALGRKCHLNEMKRYVDVNACVFVCREWENDGNFPRNSISLG